MFPKDHSQHWIGPFRGDTECEECKQMFTDSQPVTTTPNAKAFIEKLIARLEYEIQEMDKNMHYPGMGNSRYVAEGTAYALLYINRHRSEWE